MGSQDLQDKGIDATVGGLVWVRRRNGSWWPGQIIDEEECGDTSMASPRAGTPVKLLGRDDVNVDWYNLEKSKRVKPFRCGEYDNCIEKAKRAAANPKKAAKYARREDAIIQALEIEMKHKSIDPDNPVDMDDDINDYEGNNTSVHVLNEDPNQVRRPRRTPNDDDDDGNEGVKRMRDLDDLGMGPVQAMKRTRTLVGHVHEFLKKKNRSRPLTHVLESSAMVGVPYPHVRILPNGCASNELNQSSSVDINNFDSIGISHENSIWGNGHASESILVSCKSKEKEISDMSANLEKGSSEKLFDVPLVSKRTMPAETGSKLSYKKLWDGAEKQSSQSSETETISLGNEESASTSSGAADVDSFSLGIENGNSRWQSKGKRNSRSMKSKNPNTRKISNVDEDFDDNNLDEYWGQCGRSSSKISSLNTPRSLPYRQSRSIMNPKYGPEFSLINHDDCDAELYDVNIDVKASSRRQHVPFISLMSKLTGKPVVGHPIAVEILEDGYTDILVNDAKRDLNNNMYGIKVPSKHLKPHHVSPNKSIKLRKSSQSSKKIRKLSSLTGYSRLNAGEQSLGSEKMMGPALACVPLKIVYSRMNAYLKGMMTPRGHVAKPKGL